MPDVAITVAAYDCWKMTDCCHCASFRFAEGNRNPCVRVNSFKWVARVRRFSELSYNLMNVLDAHTSGLYKVLGVPYLSPGECVSH